MKKKLQGANDALYPWRLVSLSSPTWTCHWVSPTYLRVKWPCRKQCCSLPTGAAPVPPYHSWGTAVWVIVDEASSQGLECLLEALSSLRA